MKSEVPEGSKYWDLFNALPEKIKQKARVQARKFKDDLAAGRSPRSSLEFKKMRIQENLYEVCVSHADGYRAVGEMVGDTIRWRWIGNHQDFDRRYGRKVRT